MSIPKERNAGKKTAPLNWSLQMPCYGTNGAFFIDTTPGESWRIELSPPADWIRGLDSGDSGKGPMIVNYSVAPNPFGARRTTISVIEDSKGEVLKQEVSQESGESPKMQSDSVLRMPFLTTPRTMEIGIAGKFVAQQIKEIPEPFTLPGLLAAELIVIAGGIAAVGVRAALAPLVPEPSPIFELPPFPSPAQDIPVPEIMKDLPATTIVIAEETVALAIYLAQQVLEE